jgi:lipoprotein-releasing system permease protein
MTFPLHLALRYLRPHRNGVSVLAVIAVVGILLGVAVQMIVMAVMTGYGGGWHEKILSFKPHVTIRHASGLITDVDEVAAAVSAASPEVVSVRPSAQTPVMARHGDRILTPIAVGFDMDRPGIIDTVREHMLAGRFDISGSNCVLGDDLAYELNIGLGDRILVYSPLNLNDPDTLYLPEELTVAGVFTMGMREYDSAFLLASLETVLDLVGEFDGAQSLQVQVDNPYEVYPSAVAMARALGPEYRVQTWQQADAVLFGALQTEKTMMFVLLVVISIVAVFCVVNTLIVVTLKKTREIGLLKALGFSGAKIVGVFVVMGQIQCVAGTLLGVLCGWGFLHRLNDIVAFLAQHGRDVFPKEIYMFSNMPWKIVPGDLALTVVSVHVFCLLASLVPAWRAARMDPVVALRQE